jgi:aldose 1-epimerase
MPPIELCNETMRLVVDPTNGCRIDALDLRGPDGDWHAVLGRGEDCVGSFLMVPWTNRIKNGSFSFDGGSYSLEINHPDGTAIHGVGRDHAWGIADRSPYSARFVFDSRLVEDVNWPFPFGAVFRVEIGEDWVELDLDVTNLGEESMPCGVGHHPYFMRSLWEDGDELNIRAGVGGRYPCVDQIPVDAMVDDEISTGLRKGGPIGNPGLDDVFGRFDGECELRWDKSGVRCTMQCSEAFTHMVVFTPRDGDEDGTPPLPWVCVEPVTMVNDALNSADPDRGTQVLGSNGTLQSKVRMRFDQIS